MAMAHSRNWLELFCNALPDCFSWREAICDRLMRFEILHPAVFVTAGFIFVLALQNLEGNALFLGVLGAGAMAVRFALRKWWAVLRRMRFVFLALLILFAWQTPGTLLFPALGAFSPTLDGAILALDPALRLVGATAVVATLLTSIAIDDWVSSLYVLTRPFTPLGISPERFAVRLRLVLAYAAEENIDWRESLVGATDASQGGESWPVRALGWRDRWALVLLALLVAIAWGFL